MPKWIKDGVVRSQQQPMTSENCSTPGLSFHTLSSSFAAPKRGDNSPENLPCVHINRSTMPPRTTTKADYVIPAGRRNRACVGCHQRPRSVMFLPCSHQITCSSCADVMENCATCGRTILGTCVPERNLSHLAQ